MAKFHSVSIFVLFAIISMSMVSGIFSNQNNVAFAQEMELKKIDVFTGEWCHPDGLETPKTIHVGILLNNIGKIDMKAGEYEADFWYVIWSDDVNFIEDGLPPVGFPNGFVKQISSEYIEEHYYEVRMIGMFFANMDLSLFPFETIPLTIEVEPDTPCYTDSIVFEYDADTSGVDSRAYVPGWNIGDVSFEAMEHYYEGYDLTYARFVAQFDIERPLTSSVMNILFPVFMITALSVMVFWIPENYTPRIYLSAPLLLALVYLHTGAMKDLPPLAYLTIYDKVMFINFALFANTILSLALQMRFHVNGQELLIKKVNSIQRYLIPVIALVLGLILWNL